MKDDATSPSAQTVVFLGLGGILAIGIALFQGKLNLFVPSVLIWNMILLVLMLTPGFLLAYRSYKLIGAGEVVLFLSTGRIWNVVGAFFFLHEAVTLQMFFAAFIIVLGIAITRYEKKKFTVNKGVIFVLLAAFLYGMSDIDGYYILRTMNATNFLIYSDLLPVAAILILLPKTFKKIGYYFTRERATKLLLLCFCDTFGTLALYLSYQAGGKASIIGPLSATRVLLTTILAMIILKERNNITNKLIGAAVTVVGVILLL